MRRVNDLRLLVVRGRRCWLGNLNADLDLDLNNREGRVDN